MKNNKTITILVLLISLLSMFAAATGIFSDRYYGPDEFMSIHGKVISIYGKGIYHNMSADVAIQGIAQDYITLFIGIPLLLVSLALSRKGSLRGRFLLAGVLNYFLVTYLFYLEIAMFNELFLVYVALTGMSFFAFINALLSFDINTLAYSFSGKTPVKAAGGFLIFTSFMIAMLWLSVVVPPLLSGTIIPEEVQHYTTLTVQGLDLAIFLPVSFVSGFLLIRKNRFGYLMAPVTLVFLPLLMTALIAKLVAMASAGANVIPAVFLIPVIAAAALVFCIILMRNMKHEQQ